MSDQLLVDDEWVSAVEAHLAAMPMRRKPVAWRIRFKGDTAWTLLHTQPKPAKDMEIDPLYSRDGR